VGAPNTHYADRCVPPADSKLEDTCNLLGEIFHATPRVVNNPRELTRDDTYVQGLVDDGLITAEQARHHPHKSLITASLQGRSFSASLTTLNPKSSDRYLLCSDGLSDIVTEDAIADVMRSAKQPEACAERLVQLALQAGGPDNVTVVVADLG